MKSARELFEELGYEYDESCDGILYAKYIDSDRCGVEQHSISFDKVDKTVEKYVGEAGFSHKYYRANISLKELQAINKQIEELECDDIGDEELKGYLIQRIDTFKEILSKYKEIIGKK